MPKPNRSFRYSPQFHRVFSFLTPLNPSDRVDKAISVWDEYKNIKFIYLKYRVKAYINEKETAIIEKIDEKNRVFLSILDRILSVKKFNMEQFASCFTALEKLETMDKSKEADQSKKEGQPKEVDQSKEEGQPKEESQSTKKNESYLDNMNQIIWILKNIGQLNFRAFNVVYRKMRECSLNCVINNLS